MCDTCIANGTLCRKPEDGAPELQSDANSRLFYERMQRIASADPNWYENHGQGD